MADVPGNSTTTSSVTVGSTTSGTLETIGDHDWYRINLTAGQAITVTLHGVTLDDSYLQIRNSAGAVLYDNDDISSGVNRDSRVSFAASTTGVYYIDAGAYNDAGTGTYQVSVATFNPPPVGTVDQFAYQLNTGYYGGATQHFNVTQGGQITVNVTALTAAGQTLAHNALALWSDIIGVNFVDVTTGGQIVFDDNQDGAFTEQTTSGGITTRANVNISTQWLTDYGTTTNSYGFQTYVHEIGHALGLGHAGNYNDTATYPYDALYANDSWAMSVMSYFDQNESSYYADRNFTRAYAVTPMVADIVAVGQLYGLSTTTRTGDTTYGFNSNAGRAVFDASLNPSVAYTVFDSGGNDTLDFSGFSQPQKIDLNQEAYSNVGGRVGTVFIARGTIIENAIGGSGADQLIGNPSDNVLRGGGGGDVLTGGGGADTFAGTIAQMNGDTITDFNSADHILFSNGTTSAFTSTATTLTYAGATINFASAVSGTWVPTAVSGGMSFGLQTSAPSVTLNGTTGDFNGDGRDDIVWRNDSGAFSDWLGQLNGGFVPNDAVAARQIATSWNVVGSADFNGDGRSDLLWRNSSGALSDWLGQANGGFVTNDANAATTVPTSWKVAGVGDINGDGRADIVWRNDSGTFSDWLGQANGGFVTNDANALQQIPTNWTVVGVGDINGDGRADILWRNTSGTFSDWLGQANGGFAQNDANALTNVPTSWHVVGVGDFNGDGRSDVLWRNDDGTVSDWLGTAAGGFVQNDANAAVQVPTSWHVSGVGDYNGDGRADILWRNDSGVVSDWLGKANGGFITNDVNAQVSVSNSWHVHPADILFV